MAPKVVSSLSILIFVLLFAAACSATGNGDGHLQLTGEYPIRQEPSLVTQGLNPYTTYCAHCHGTGSAPPMAQNIPTHSASGHTWHHPDRLLVSWILDGVPGGVTMPRFRGQLTEQEARAIVAYMKTFWTDSQRQQQQTISATYESNS